MYLRNKYTTHKADRLRIECGQNNDPDKLASELLHVPGGLSALATKLSSRAEKEKVSVHAKRPVIFTN